MSVASTISIISPRSNLKSSLEKFKKLQSAWKGMTTLHARSQGSVTYLLKHSEGEMKVVVFQDGAVIVKQRILRAAVLELATHTDGRRD